MPRPPRIEYEGAFHHVMNRGRDSQTIYWDDEDYVVFLGTLAEVTKEYHAVIHAYCLMTNHYHLLIETPKANLSQIMKHINGFYTQRFNRKYKKDGALFRGRYKSILVDEDSYLLQLTRYIHRNPVEVKKKMVKQLSDYPWSSYPAYINQAKAPDWLFREKTYQMLGHRYRYKGYYDFVEKGIDEGRNTGQAHFTIYSKLSMVHKQEVRMGLEVALILAEKLSVKDVENSLVNTSLKYSFRKDELCLFDVYSDAFISARIINAEDFDKFESTYTKEDFDAYRKTLNSECQSIIELTLGRGENQWEFCLYFFKILADLYSPIILEDDFGNIREQSELLESYSNICLEKINSKYSAYTQKPSNYR